MRSTAAVRVSWGQALGWRLRRNLLAPPDLAPPDLDPPDLDPPDLDPPTALDPVAVAERLCGVQAQVPAAAELAVAVRTGDPATTLADGLDDGRLVRTWAARGTLHVLPVPLAARQLSLLAAARTWHTSTWQRTFAPLPVMTALAAEVHAALADGPLTRSELVARVSGAIDHHDLADQLRSGWSTLLKPLAWQGVLCQGPARGRSVTFARPDLLLPTWPGLPDPDDAGPAALRDYLGAFGPAAPEAFGAWLLRGAVRKADLRRWITALGDDAVEVDVEGRSALLLAEHVDDLLSARPPDGAVHLLPGFDQYVLGPGTADPVVVPAEHRASVSRAGGWISPVVLVEGRVAGTWEDVDGEPRVSPLPGVVLPGAAVAAAVGRTAALLAAGRGGGGLSG